MQQALNRERMIDTVYNGLAGLPGHGVAPANKDFYANTKASLGSFDLKAAGAALDAIGLKDSDGDGVRNIAKGKNLEFDLTYGTDSSVYPAIATIIQNDFKQIGVNVQFFATTPNLQRILHALETQQPYLVVENITLRPLNAFRGFKPAPGQEPEINVQLDVAGFAFAEPDRK